MDFKFFKNYFQKSFNFKKFGHTLVLIAGFQPGQKKLGASLCRAPAVHQK